MFKRIKQIFMKKFLHKIAHLFGLNHVVAESYFLKDELIPAIRCRTCGKIKNL